MYNMLKLNIFVPQIFNILRPNIISRPIINMAQSTQPEDQIYYILDQMFKPNIFRPNIYFCRPNN